MTLAVPPTAETVLRSNQLDLDLLRSKQLMLRRVHPSLPIVIDSLGHPAPP